MSNCFSLSLFLPFFANTLVYDYNNNKAMLHKTANSAEAVFVTPVRLQRFFRLRQIFNTIKVMIATFEDRLLSALRAFNHILHALLAIALVLASLMVMWEFSVAVFHAVEVNNLAHGFLQASGYTFYCVDPVEPDFC